MRGWACRRYPMEGIANFRDLGGYACQGGITRWGIFFRSTSLYKAEPRDIRMLEQIGIRTILDLRYPHEQEQMPDKKVEGVSWYGVSLMGGIPVEEIRVNDTVPGTRTLIRMYRQIIRCSGEQIAEAVRLMIQAEGPALFHCAAGKDRTGILAMLLLGSVGVSEEDILSDYQVSANYIKSFTTDCSGSHESNMSRLMAEIRAGYGTTAGYLKACGLTEEELECLRRKFVQTEGEEW